jgi:hypothetical protein
MDVNAVSPMNDCPEASGPFETRPGPAAERSAHGPIFWGAVLVCLWFPFQDLVLAFLYGRGAPATAIRGLLVLKEAVVLLLVGAALLRWTLGGTLRAAGADVAALLYAALLTVYLFVGDAEMQPRLLQYRSLMLPVLLYFCGRALPRTPEAVRTWVRFTLGLAVLVAALGLFERLALGIDFWYIIVPLGSFLEDIKGQSEHVLYGLPGNMYGDYGFGFFQFRRLAGSFGSPLTMGYYLVFPMLLLFCLVLVPSRPAQAAAAERAQGASGLLAGLLVCGLALMLTVTRAGIGAVIVGVALAVLLYRQVRLLVFAGLIAAGFAVLFEGYLGRMLEATLTMDDSSTRGHYLFLVSSLEVVLEFPLGLGMGSAGGWSHTMSDRFSGAAENAFLVIVAQASIYAGLLFFLFCFAALGAVHRAERDAGSALETAFLRAVLISGVALLVTGLLSEQILTFTSVGHFWMSLGLAVTVAGRPPEPEP